MIPRKKFGQDWRPQQRCLAFIDAKENFRDLRWAVGNPLGNYRWLHASDNRSRGADTLDPGDAERDFIEDVPAWNVLIERSSWNQDDVAAFQRLIDLRSLAIYQALLVQGRRDIFASGDPPGLGSSAATSAPSLLSPTGPSAPLQERASDIL